MCNNFYFPQQLWDHAWLLAIHASRQAQVLRPSQHFWQIPQQVHPGSLPLHRNPDRTSLLLWQTRANYVHHERWPRPNQFRNRGFRQRSSRKKVCPQFATPPPREENDQWARNPILGRVPDRSIVLEGEWTWATEPKVYRERRGDGNTLRGVTHCPASFKHRSFVTGRQTDEGFGTQTIKSGIRAFTKGSRRNHHFWVSFPQSAQECIPKCTCAESC